MKKILLILSIGFLLSFVNGKPNKASWYGGTFHGKKMANGDKFNKHKLTCAANNFDLGTFLKITNKHNGKSVEVKVTDRIANRYSSRIDLSEEAFRQISKLEKGVIHIEVEVL